VVEWTLRENELQGEGVPNDFKVAILVQHAGVPFQSTVKVKATTRSNLALFGRPWPKPDPLIFSPTVSLGLPLGLQNFDDLKDGNWKDLTGFDDFAAVSID
jgi:hypothetical protein